MFVLQFALTPQLALKRCLALYESHPPGLVLNDVFICTRMVVFKHRCAAQKNSDSGARRLYFGRYVGDGTIFRDVHFYFRAESMVY